MRIRPIKKTNISDDIADQIKESILDGTLQLGERLPGELELAQKFGTSRTSLREAMRGLVSVGLIERTREGTYVSKSGLNFVSDPLIYKLALKRIGIGELIEARKFIEVPIAETAAIRRDEEDISKLEDSLEYMRSESTDPKNFAVGGLDFHLLVASASKNLVLYELLYTVRNLQMVSNMEVTRSAETAMKTISAHQKILLCIKDRDAAGAGRNMAEHILGVEEQLRKMGTLK